jgi:hypothetical protein
MIHGWDISKVDRGAEGSSLRVTSPFASVTEIIDFVSSHVNDDDKPLVTMDNLRYVGRSEQSVFTAFSGSPKNEDKDWVIRHTNDRHDKDKRDDNDAKVMRTRVVPIAFMSGAIIGLVAPLSGLGAIIYGIGLGMFLSSSRWKMTVTPYTDGVIASIRPNAGWVYRLWARRKLRRMYGTSNIEFVNGVANIHCASSSSRTLAQAEELNDILNELWSKDGHYRSETIHVNPENDAIGNDPKDIMLKIKSTAKDTLPPSSPLWDLINRMDKSMRDQDGSIPTEKAQEFAATLDDMRMQSIKDDGITEEMDKAMEDMRKATLTMKSAALGQSAAQSIPVSDTKNHGNSITDAINDHDDTSDYRGALVPVRDQGNIISHDGDRITELFQGYHGDQPKEDEFAAPVGDENRVGPVTPPEDDQDDTLPDDTDDESKSKSDDHDKESTGTHDDDPLT